MLKTMDIACILSFFASGFGCAGSEAVGEQSEHRYVIDDMEDVTDWVASGAARTPELSDTGKQGRHCMRWSKAGNQEDYARYSKTLGKAHDFSSFDEVSYWIYLPEVEGIKHISLWFGEEERWGKGFLQDHPNPRKGWQRVQSRLYLSQCVGAVPKSWKNIQVVSFEITTETRESTFEGILIDDLKLTRSASQGLRRTADTSREPPFAVVDGEPFFPIGFYGVSDQITAAEWAELAQNGFNLVTCAEAHYFNERVCTHGDTSHWLRFLDKAHRHGIKVVVQLSAGDTHNHIWWALDLNDDAVLYRHLRRIGRDESNAVGSANRERSIRYLQKIVPALKDHPALYCWESLDEIAQYGFPAAGMQEGAKLLRGLDASHPLWINHPSSVIDPRALHEFGHFADIVSLDIYPVPKEFGFGNLPNKEINNIGEYTDLLRASATPEQPVWMVLQAYRFNDDEFAHLKDERLRRFPTSDEIRFMSYQAVVHGTKGIMYFLYLPRATKRPAHTHVNTPFTPEFWEALKSLGRELQFLKSALTSKTVVGAVRVESEADSVRCMVKQVGDDIFLITVNERKQSTRATFKLNRPIQKLNAIFENRDLAFTTTRLRTDSTRSECASIEFASEPSPVF
jgi:hypothetical protein